MSKTLQFPPAINLQPSPKINKFSSNKLFARDENSGVLSPSSVKMPLSCTPKEEGHKILGMENKGRIPYILDSPIGHTAGHRDCPACENSRIEAMKQQPQEFKLLSFSEAAQVWLEIKQAHTKKPRTMEMYRWYIANLSKFFDGMLLSQVHIGTILEYQRLRSNGSHPWTRRAGPSCVNHELNTLAQILSYADLWDVIGKNY